MPLLLLLFLSVLPWGTARMFEGLALRVASPSIVRLVRAVLIVRWSTLLSGLTRGLPGLTTTKTLGAIRIVAGVMLPA